MFGGCVWHVRGECTDEATGPGPASPEAALSLVLEGKSARAAGAVNRHARSHETGSVLRRVAEKVEFCDDRSGSSTKMAEGWRIRGL